MIEKGWWVQLDFLHLDVGYKNDYENVLKAVTTVMAPRLDEGMSGRPGRGR